MKYMTQATGAPGESQETAQITNPNLPEGFEITEEMLLDPTVMYFLKNYQGPINVRFQDFQKGNHRRTGMYHNDLEGFITEISSGELGEDKLELGGELNIDFSDFDMYAYHFLIDGEEFSLSTHERNRLEVLQQFLPPNKRKKFEELFGTTQYINWVISGIKDEVASLTHRVDDGIDRAGVRKWTKSEIERIMRMLQKNIDALN